MRRARVQDRARRGQGSRSCAAGFSLLEVLVALSLLALILAAMPSVVQLARRAWESSQAIDRAGSDAIAVRFLRDRIAQAMPLAGKVAEGSAPILFEGAVDRAIFVAPSIEGPPGTGLFVFEVSSIRRANGLMAVVLRWRPYQPAFEDEALAQLSERIVLDDVASFGLRYFGRHAETSVRGWSEAWPRSNLLPEMVELRLVSPARLVGDPGPMVIELLAQDVTVGR